MSKYTLSMTGQLLLNRLHKQYKEHGKLLIAFDFDDTVYPFTWPDELLKPIRDILLLARKQGHDLICYTANDDLESVSEFLTYHGIAPDYYNRSPVASNGKIFYNIFLDDKCGLEETYNILKQFLEETK